MEGGFYDLDGPVARVCSAEVPMPYARHMEDAALPQADDHRGRGPGDARAAMAEFLMPILGADMTAGTLIAWRKQPGDRVRRGDIIAEVETEKGADRRRGLRERRARALLVEPGATVPDGNGAGHRSARTARRGRAEPPSPLRAAPPRRRPARPPRPDPPRRRVRLAAARKLRPARHRSGHAPWHRAGRRGHARGRRAGRGGRPAAPAAAAPRGAGATAQARMRQTIAAAMARSKREIPHYYLAHTIDMHRALAWLAERERASAR